jgi:hypothetical protein
MNVLITGERGKLPPIYAALVDPMRPIPADVSFFEKRVVAADLAKTFMYVVGFGIAGVVIAIFGTMIAHSASVHLSGVMGISPILVGLVFVFAAYMMFSSLKVRREILAQQASGEQTRVGIFLTADAIFEASELGFCIVPREHFQGRDGRTIKYVLAGQDKSYLLPGVLVSGSPEAMHAAIDGWAGRG